MRKTSLALAAAVVAVVASMALHAQGTRSTVQVYKDPSCGCCEKWVDHLKQAGFTVSARTLHTWTPYTGLDPESQFVGTGSPLNVDQAHLPQLMTMVLTLRLSY